LGTENAGVWIPAYAGMTIKKARTTTYSISPSLYPSKR